MALIEYLITLDNGNVYQFKVDLDRSTDVDEGTRNHAFWTRLGFNQCSHCPLDATVRQCCPPAMDLEHIAANFANIISYEKVWVEVNTPERTYRKRCDAQTGLRSLLGLVMARSSCPILMNLRELARFHLPFATIEETLFRSTSVYLLKQYFLYKEGKQPDWDLVGLEQLYEDLQTLNRCFKGRLDAASKLDANANAIGSLIYLSMAVSFSLEERLMEFKKQFQNGHSTSDGI
jgi:hypothetical protein